jgi:hypothetical protein
VVGGDALLVVVAEVVVPEVVVPEVVVPELVVPGVVVPETDPEPELEDVADPAGVDAV